MQISIGNNTANTYHFLTFDCEKFIVASLVYVASTSMMTIQATIAFAVLALMRVPSASAEVMVVNPCFGACVRALMLTLFV
jgi:hypothetical protein